MDFWPAPGYHSNEFLGSSQGLAHPLLVPSPPTAVICKTHVTPELEFTVATDVGLVRERNEDNYLALPEQRLFVVADGMGGHASGDVASRICADSVRRFYTDTAAQAAVEEAWTRVLAEAGGEVSGLDVRDFRLYKALETANLAIFRAAAQYEKHRTMGTTVVAAHVVGDSLIVAHVGDSRLYRLRGDTCNQVTEDHSLANEYLRLNLIKKEDLPRFAYKNVIVRALGLADSVQVDLFREQLEAGDRYLLCSDGLTDLVTDDTTAAVLMEARTTEEAALVLVDFANQAGGHDNTTVIVFDVLTISDND